MSLVLISTTCWDCKIHWSPTYLMIHCVLELYPVCQVFFPSNYSIISADYFNQMIIWLIGIKVMSSTPSRLRWPSISYRITNMLSFNRIWEELVLEGGKQCTHLDCWCSKFELCFSNAFIAEQINITDAAVLLGQLTGTEGDLMLTHWATASRSSLQNMVAPIMTVQCALPLPGLRTAWSPIHGVGWCSGQPVPHLQYEGIKFFDWSFNWTLHH